MKIPLELWGAILIVHHFTYVDALRLRGCEQSSLRLCLRDPMNNLAGSAEALESLGPAQQQEHWEDGTSGDDSSESGGQFADARSSSTWTTDPIPRVPSSEFFGGESDDSIHAGEILPDGHDDDAIDLAQQFVNLDQVSSNAPVSSQGSRSAERTLAMLGYVKRCSSVRDAFANYLMSMFPRDRTGTHRPSLIPGAVAAVLIAFVVWIASAVHFFLAVFVFIFSTWPLLVRYDLELPFGLEYGTLEVHNPLRRKIVAHARRKTIANRAQLRARGGADVSRTHAQSSIFTEDDWVDAEDAGIVGLFSGSAVEVRKEYSDDIFQSASSAIGAPSVKLPDIINSLKSIKSGLPEMCMPSKRSEFRDVPGGDFFISGIDLNKFFQLFWSGTDFACALGDSVKLYDDWDGGHRWLKVERPPEKGGHVQQDQYLFHETNNALVLIKTSSCHGVSPMFENDFRLLEKWMVHDDNDGAGTTGVRVMVQTGVKWIKSWSPAKMGEGQMHADVGKVIRMYAESFKEAALSLENSLTHASRIRASRLHASPIYESLN